MVDDVVYKKGNQQVSKFCFSFDCLYSEANER